MYVVVKAVVMMRLNDIEIPNAGVGVLAPVCLIALYVHEFVECLQYSLWCLAVNGKVELFRQASAFSLQCFMIVVMIVVMIVSEEEGSNPTQHQEQCCGLHSR